ncbi:MAG: 30S ribosomal protein S9 [Syntrophales bacterium]|jgi:small subunit ribosomal protein S9|nr:30S ribosomal protein S9 [Syntrophales bacterium]MCK9527895.1 30S ribosomal protein S9 [Syntrophales bacterium]MDX9921930.1 30S ribosomal protein S9 [Syntrophales bacterium]
MAVKQYYATGKRKTAVARVWMREGSGEFVVNKRNFDDYFQLETVKNLVNRPLDVTDMRGKFDVRVNVRGGGTSGQAGAIKHGISKALVEYDESLKAVLRKAGFLTRDARIKERKKYGQPGARKRFQYSKR